MRVPSTSVPRPSVRQEIRPGVWVDSRLAVWIAEERLLVVADLHWGYAASHRARGNLLPVWGDEELDARLRALIEDYRPAEMLWLGDVVHAAEGSARAERFLATAPIPVTLIAGNHDRRWRGRGEPAVQRGAWYFHHGDRALAVPAGATEVVGHHHPAIAWGDQAGSHVKLPALVVAARRLVLPAFSPWAAGTSWDEQPGETLWAIAPHRIFALPRRPVAPLSAIS